MVVYASARPLSNCERVRVLVRLEMHEEAPRLDVRMYVKPGRQGFATGLNGHTTIFVASERRPLFQVVTIRW